MIKTIEEYLQLLKKELSGSDRAIVQDALFDAEEHLNLALENKLAGAGDTLEQVLPAVIEEFGSPEEVAAAYREVEYHTEPALSASKKKRKRGVLAEFFGVYANPQAWAALFFCFFSFITGVVYFCWAITGLSASIGFSILIFGVPFLALFLLSVRGIALLEGRIVEALLGVRMPRRSIFVSENLSLVEKIKYLITDKNTWLNILYMVLQLPLGTLYFCIFVTLLATSLALMAAPFVQAIFHLPLVQLRSGFYWVPQWLLGLSFLTGFLLLPASLHLARGIGKLHGKLARSLLVSRP